MYLWAGFYKTGTNNIEEALKRMGLGNYRPTSQKCGFFHTFKGMTDNNLFAGILRILQKLCWAKKFMRNLENCMKLS